MLMNKMAKSGEKHHSMDGIEQSVFFRIFVLKFISTGEAPSDIFNLFFMRCVIGCLYLILNRKFVSDIVGEVGLDEDFSIAWYESVAPMLVTLMAGVIRLHSTIDLLLTMH